MTRRFRKKLNEKAEPVGQNRFSPQLFVFAIEAETNGGEPEKASKPSHCDTQGLSESSGFHRKEVVPHL
jgi:hypothetical protein